MLVLIRPEAEQELYQAASWYEQREVGVGLRFLLSYESALRRVENDPKNLPPHEAASEGRDIRRSNLKRFPYSIIVELCETEAVILAVAHARRRIGYWRNRGSNG